MTMAQIYLPMMFIFLIIGHYGINSRYQSKLVVGLSLATIWLGLMIVSGFRTGIGDTYFYKHTYKYIGTQLKNMPLNEVLATFDGEQGFYYMIVFLNFISEDPQLLVFICALVTNTLNLYSMYKHSKPFELGIFLYFATVIFYVTMNGMRQTLVASIFFWAVRFVIKGKPISYMVTVAILTLFHTSAILLFPIYFIVRHKAWDSFFLKLCAVGGFIFAIFPVIRPIVVKVLCDGQYSAYGVDMATGGEGVSLIRVAVMLVPLILAYLVKDELAIKWKESHIFVYMSLLNFIFILWGIQYLYFYRVCIYFELFNLALIPRMIGCLKKKMAQCAYIALITFYTVFTYYQVAICWGEKFSNILFN